MAATNSTEYWLSRRRAMIQAVRGAPKLASQSQPDVLEPLGPSHSTPEGVTALVWNMTGKFPITSTVFHARKHPEKISTDAFLFHHGHTNCVCGPQLHCSAAGTCKCTPGCQSGLRTGWPGHSWWDLYNVSGFFHSMGYDVFILSMPLKGVNKGPGNGTDSHWYAY